MTPISSTPTSAIYEYPPQAVSWLKRDLLLFANTIGCKMDELHFLFELHPRFAAFPTYPVVLPFKLNDQEVSDTLKRIRLLQKTPVGPPLDVSRYVDAERYITILKPLPVTSAGRSFTLNQKCYGIYDKGEHTVHAFQTELVDVLSGEAYAHFINTGIALGQGGWGGPKGPPLIRYAPPHARGADYIIGISTSQEAALLYRLNGDYHPHNVDPIEARRTGFPRPILPGLATWNMTARALLHMLCAGNPTSLWKFGARFAGVVYPGDQLAVEIWLLRAQEIGDRSDCESYKINQDDLDEVRFRVKVGERVVLSDGRALLRMRRVMKDAGSRQLSAITTPSL